MHEQNSGSSGDPKGSPLFWARQVPSWIRWRLRSGGPRTQPSGANPKVTGSNPAPATIMHRPGFRAFSYGPRWMIISKRPSTFGNTHSILQREERDFRHRRGARRCVLVAVSYTHLTLPTKRIV